MTRGVLSVLMSIALVGVYTPAVFAGTDSQINFKIYSPETNSAVTPAPADATPAAETGASTDNQPAAPDASNSATSQQPTPAASVAADDSKQTTPQADAAQDTSAPAAASSDSLKTEAPVTSAPTEATTQPAATASPANSAFDTTPAASTSTTTDSAASTPTAATTPSAPADTAASTGAVPDTAASTGAVPDAAASPDANAATATAGDDKSKVLQGYVRVVPKDTKIPIIMDTAVDSDTSQEGDEFEARTSEDLTIDGQIAVPAGSVIKGRIAQLNAPRRLNRNGSVALKFDTVTTPDNRQIPLVANLVAHGGVVHARRGLKDIAIDCGTFALPTAAGLAIGAIAGNANQGSLGVGGGALIGAGVGAAVGIAVLLAKKGQRIDVRPGDELKIELAEDLRMPMM